MESLRDDMAIGNDKTESIIKENEAIRARLSDLEDRTRRDNLLFFNIADSPDEKWEQSEEKVMNVIRGKLALTISSADISRAHRIGTSHPGKTRPIIVKFSNFKVKEQVLHAKSQLKGSDITISEDFSPSTRHARKKLVEFARQTSPDEQFSLRYNKLVIKKKCYMYCPVTNAIHEQAKSKTVTNYLEQTFQSKPVTCTENATLSSPP